ncbi:MAG TPA: Fic family protein [Gemmataceae bacterium]|nr:Fic family protein [Gemmataceae bacterium]
MLPEEFTAEAPGKVSRSVLGHWTFEPDRLPPTLSIDLPLLERISEADRALGELAGLGRVLPNPHLLIRPFLSREAVLSSRIEGTVTRLDQLFLFEVQPDEVEHPADAAEVSNYVRAVEHGLEQIRRGVPFSLHLIREVHSTLLTGVRGGDKHPGEIRSRPVRLGRAGQSYDQARFVPPCHTKLGPLLDDFIRFLRDERKLPIIIQLALMHYQFETIHPFNDGNGRVGRLLITLMLCERQCLPAPLLYLSAFFEQHREEYYDRLLEVSRRGAWNDWIEFFAQGVAEQAHDATMRSRRLLDLWQEYRHRAPEIVRSSVVLRLIDQLFTSPFITMNRASSVMGISFKSATKNMEKLVEASILREITGQQRYRVYVAHEIFRLLDEPLSPEPAEP